MPTFQLPSINQSICTGWTQLDNDLYQKLPFYFAKTQVDYMDTWAVWSKFTGRMPWKPNMGTTMRGVRTVPSPNLRQNYFPQPLTGTPQLDMLAVRDVATNEVLYQGQFESPNFYFLPEFQDFMGHIEATRRDIQEKITRANDIFIRGKVFHRSPYVWLPNKVGGEAVAAPCDSDGNNAGTTGKTTAWIIAQLALLGMPGNLSFDTISRVLPFMSTSLRAPAFTGSNKPGSTGGPSGKYVLVCSSEAYGRFPFDPYLKANRSIDLDIVLSRFRGDIFGQITCMLEDMPLRIKSDGTFPAPETIEEDPAALNFGESIPNPQYTEIENCPYEVAFLVGSEGYKSLEVGPPPSAFTGKGIPEGFGRMMWNGEIQMTKDLLVPCLDENGVLQQMTNKYGRYLQLISWLVLGCMAVQPRWIVPIIFKRIRGNGGTTGT